MPTSGDFKMLAQSRLDEAELLHANRMYLGAYYLAGYTAEFALKAAICKRLDIEMFDGSRIVADAAKPLFVHKLDTLLIFSGLHSELQREKANPAFDAAWSEVSAWKEDRRYNPTSIIEPQSRDFLNAINTFLTWIHNFW